MGLFKRTFFVLLLASSSKIASGEVVGDQNPATLDAQKNMIKVSANISESDVAAIVELFRREKTTTTPEFIKSIEPETKYCSDFIRVITEYSGRGYGRLVLLENRQGQWASVNIQQSNWRFNEKHDVHLSGDFSESDILEILALARAQQTNRSETVTSIEWEIRTCPKSVTVMTSYDGHGSLGGGRVISMERKAEAWQILGINFWRS